MVAFDRKLVENYLRSWVGRTKNITHILNIIEINNNVNDRFDDIWKVNFFDKVHTLVKRKKEKKINSTLFDRFETYSDSIKLYILFK